MNYQTINARELTQKAVEKHGSQYSVAKITGVNHALISKMINGKLTNPTLDTINKLLACLPLIVTGFGFSLALLLVLFL